MNDNQQGEESAHTHTHTGWPEVYLIIMRTSKKASGIKSTISLLAHAGRSEAGREKAECRTYGHLREQRGMTERKEEKEETASSDLLQWRLYRNERARPGQRYLMNSWWGPLMSTTAKRKKKKKTPTLLSHIHSFSGSGRENTSRISSPRNNKIRWWKMWRNMERVSQSEFHLNGRYPFLVDFVPDSAAGTKHWLLA